jgi:hypothetical protein
MICGQLKKYTSEEMECVAILAVSEIYDVSVGICFVSEGQITQAPIVIAGEAVTERNSGYPVV